MFIDFPASLRRVVAALALVAVAACGGGDFAESFVKLVTARFVPAQATLLPGASVTADLEVSCDRAALDTVFGRLGVRVRLDPSHTLAGGVTATLGGVADAEGFHLFPCNSATSDPDLRVAHIPVTIAVAAGTPALATTLQAYVEVEPLLVGEPSKDNTSAQMVVTVGAVEAPVAPAPGLGAEQLVDGAFHRTTPAAARP